MKKCHRLNHKPTYFFIIFIFCIVLSAFIYFYSSDALHSSMETSLTELAKQGAETVTRDIERNFVILETLAKLDVLKSTTVTVEEKLEILSAYVKPEGLLRINIADLDGYSKSTDEAEIFIGDREHFIKAREGYRNVSNIIKGRIDNSHIVVFAVPIFNEEKIVNILLGTYPAEELSSITDKIKFGRIGNSFIIDKNGTVIAHENRKLVFDKFNLLEDSPQNSNLDQLKRLIRKMVDGEPGAGEYYYEGVNKHMGYAPIRGTDWFLGVSAPHATIFDGIDRFITVLIIIGVFVALVILILNIYLKYVREKLGKQERLSQNAIEAAQIIIFSFDKDGKIIDCNCYAQEKTGYKYDEIVHKKTIYDLIAYKDKEKVQDLINNSNLQKTQSNIEFPILSNQWEEIHVLWNINSSDPARIKDNIEIMGIDITEKVLSTIELQAQHDELNALYEELAASEEELKDQYEKLCYHQEKVNQYAYYDVVTELPNRINFSEKFEELVNEERKATLIFMDLDDFKFINDSYGHAFGDLLLKEVGERLQGLKDYDYMVSRLGGDEYGILLMDVYSHQEIKTFCSLLIESFNESYEIEKIQLHMSVSMGIVQFPKDGTSFEELLKYADIAMYKAKELGKNRYVFYTKKMNDELMEKLTTQMYMKNALSNNEFVLYYQPQFHASKRNIVGFEALVRWDSPELGLVSPLKFISIAEENRMIIPLGEWILETAIRFIKKVNEQYSNKLVISVNISIIQLLQDDFVDMVLKIIKEVGLEPQLLELELTESILMQSFEMVENKLERLKKVGVRIALDDFGKGYSSLTYLRKLPISTLKIDKAFIDNIETVTNEDILIETIICMGKKMGLVIVAEGVETQEQLDYLEREKCDSIQGYLLGKPMPSNRIDELLSRNQVKTIYRPNH